MPVFTQLVHFIGDIIQYLYQITGNAGVAIILLTLAIKLLLVPLTLPALRNSRRQQELSPLIREIQKKHKGDRAAATAEQMDLYRQYGFNPLNGCLPTIVQIPIFFALWRAIIGLSHTAAGNDGFLWLTRISHPDPYHILPFLAALAQFFQTRMAMQRRAEIVDPQQRSMNTMMQFMPAMVILFGWNIASGAVLYWFVSSLFSAIQQWFVTGWGSLLDVLPFLPQRHMKSQLPARRPEGYAKGSGKAGFMQRFQEKMLEAQKQQEGQRGGKSQSAIAEAPPTQEAVPAQENAALEGTQYTQDAWQLPGAPGTTGRTAFATGAAGPDVQPLPNPSSQNGQRPNNRKRKRK